MRWLLLKDLLTLRRSPLLSALLVLYPIAIAVLIGFALSRGPGDPKIAYLDEAPAKQKLTLGNREVGLDVAREEIFERLDVIDVADRAEAERRVRGGEVWGALILPPNLISDLESQGLRRPHVEVLVNEEDPLKARVVDERIGSLLTEANLFLSKQLSEVTIDYLGLLTAGGEFELLGRKIDVLGLARAERLLDEVRGDLPPEGQRKLDRVKGFSSLARGNLSLADELLESVSQPIEVRKRSLTGRAPTLDSFTIAVAAAITLMFVTVLLVAGALAHEREENTWSRLTRGLVSPTGVLAAKLALGIVCALPVTLLMLAGLELFLPLDWGRLPLWLPAIVAGSAGFAALGAALGAAAREVRVSALLAFMVALPVAFLSLVPSGAISPAAFDVIQVVRALFPFDPAVDALSGALDPSGPALGGPLAQLAALTLGYGALARLALRRFE